MWLVEGTMNKTYGESVASVNDHTEFFSVEKQFLSRSSLLFYFIFFFFASKMCLILQKFVFLFWSNYNLYFVYFYFFMCHTACAI